MTRLILTWVLNGQPHARIPPAPGYTLFKFSSNPPCSDGPAELPSSRSSRTHATSNPNAQQVQATGISPSTSLLL